MKRQNEIAIDNMINEAIRHYGKLAKSGESKAQGGLGSIYLEGAQRLEALKSSKKDYEHLYNQAYKWLKLSTKQDYLGFQYNLATIYKKGFTELGKGPEADREACKWFRLAAENTNNTQIYYLDYKQSNRQENTQVRIEAQNQLAMMYRDSRAGIVDRYESDKEACKWFHKSAQQGNLFAWYSLVKMTMAGRGGFSKGLESDIEALKLCQSAIYLYGLSVGEKELSTTFACIGITLFLLFRIQLKKAMSLQDISVDKLKITSSIFILIYLSLNHRDNFIDIEILSAQEEFLSFLAYQTIILISIINLLNLNPSIATQGFCLIVSLYISLREMKIQLYDNKHTGHTNEHSFSYHKRISFSLIMTYIVNHFIMSDNHYDLTDKKETLIMSRALDNKTSPENTKKIHSNRATKPWYFFHDNEIAAPKKQLAHNHLAKKGDPEAQFTVASWLINSDNRDRREHGLYYLSLSATQGHTQAQYALGIYYLQTLTVDNIKPAEYYLKRASEKNHEPATLTLAELYLKESSLVSLIRAETALKRLSKSKNGLIHNQAMTYLANLYNNNYIKKPTSENYEKALTQWEILRKINPMLANEKIDMITIDWKSKHLCDDKPINTQNQISWDEFHQEWGSALLMKSLILFIEFSNYKKELRSLRWRHKEDRILLERYEELECHFKLLTENRETWIDTLYKPSGNLLDLTHGTLSIHDFAHRNRISLAYIRDRLLLPLIKQGSVNHFSFLTPKNINSMIDHMSSQITPEQMSSLIFCSNTQESPSSKLSSFLLQELTQRHRKTLIVQTDNDISHLSKMYYYFKYKSDAISKTIIEERIHQYVLDTFQSLISMYGLDKPNFISSSSREQQWKRFMNALNETIASLIDSMHQVGHDDLENMLLHSLDTMLLSCVPKDIADAFLSDLSCTVNIPHTISCRMIR